MFPPDALPDATPYPGNLKFVSKSKIVVVSVATILSIPNYFVYYFKIVAYSPRSKLGTLLPPFPDLKELKLVLEVDEQKVVTFIMMYRTHCQRILDTVIRANFDEVQNFLHHFWQGMPPHITPILGTRTLVHLVGVCDSILYKAVANVLMPTVLQPFPESLTQVIRKFATQLEDWLSNALAGMPSSLQELKLDLSRRFSQVLRRQLSVNHLVQAARTVVNSSDVMSQMLSDWTLVDISSIVHQTLYTMDACSERDRATIFNFCAEFEKLLEDQAPLEAYVEWLDTMIDSCVAKKRSDPAGHVPMKTESRQFLFMWTCFGTRVIRDLTLQSAASFGSFHLLHLMLDDYVLYRIECLQADHNAKGLLRLAKGEKEEATIEDIILPDSSKVCMPIGPFITSPDSLFGRRSLLNEHMFDYDSQSDCFSSEEDDDESFLQPPFGTFTDVRDPPLLITTATSNGQSAITQVSARHLIGNQIMNSTDHQHHQQQQPLQQQYPYPASEITHQCQFPLNMSQHSHYFSFPSGVEHHKACQLQQHHDKPDTLHQDLLQQGVKISTMAIHSKDTSSGVTKSLGDPPPKTNLHQGHFSVPLPRDNFIDVYGNSNSFRITENSVHRKNPSILTPTSKNLSQFHRSMNYIDYAHHNNPDSFTVLSPEVASSYNTQERDVNGHKGLHDFTGDTVDTNTSKQSVQAIKDSFWGHTSSTASFIN